MEHSAVGRDAEAEPIVIEKVTVKRDRMVLEVRVGEGFPAETDERIAEAALRIRPTLADHACINSAGPGFSAVICRTSLPHLFEHLVIDEQARMRHAVKAGGSSVANGDDAAYARRRSGRAPSTLAFRGSTRWTDRAGRRASVQVSFEDDIDALRAVTRAAVLMRQIFSERFSMLE